MAKSRLHELAAQGQSIWIDLLSREFVHGGELEADDRGGRRHRHHLEPDDLPEGDRRRVATTTSSSASCSRRATTRVEIFFASRSTTSATRATCCGRSGTRRTARTATSRSRSTRRSPYDTDGDVRAGGRAARRRSTRPNVFIKIPATDAGLPAIEDSIARGHVDQHHADLLARALQAPSSRPTSAGSSGSSTGGGDPSKVASVASFFVSRIDTEADKRLEAVGQHRAPGQARRSPTRSSPTSTSRRRSPARAGRPRCEGRARSSGRCGRPPRPRTRPTAT